MDVPRPIVLTDLDDTLFQTTRKARPAADWRPAATDRDGAVISWMAPHQDALWRWLAATTDLIPVTGRNVAALGRVAFTWPLGGVCSHGGVILTANGDICPDWAARMASIVTPAEPVMDDIVAAALDGGIDVRARIIGDGGLPLYVSVKHNTGDETALAALGERLRPMVPADWVLHINRNNLAVMPAGVTKKSAAEMVLSRLPDRAGRPILTLGDSLSDLPFMALGHLAATPVGSQIAERVARQDLCG